MHLILATAINTILAQAIALEEHEDAISQVLGILGCGGATDIRFVGGGTSNPFIAANLTNDAAVLGELEAALAMVGVNFRAEHSAKPGSGYTDRHYSGIPATLTEEDCIGITLLLRLTPAAKKPEAGRQYHEDGTVGIDYADGSYEEFPPSCRHLVPA